MLPVPGGTTNILNAHEEVRHLQTIRDGLFFIVGPQRSGTTLLQAMLSSHSGITIPPETEFFDQVWPRRTALGPLTNAANLERVGRYVTGPNCSVGDLGLDWPAVTATLARTPGGYDDLFTAILSLHAHSRGKRRAGEKSPRHLFAAKDLVQLFPRSKFLCLVRDPRAVARSELETSWGSRSVGRITARWCRAVDALQALERIWTAERLQVVKYETLVADPEGTLRSVCEFLEEPFETAMLQFHQRPDVERGFRADEVWKENTLRAIDASRSQQWQTELTVAQITLIERRAGARLTQRGYLPWGQPAGLFDVLWTGIGDNFRWACELVTGLLKGRKRRRPWRSVWREAFLGAPRN